MSKTPCLEFEAILEVIQQGHQPQKTGMAGQHLGECASCQKTLAETRQLLQALRDDASLVVSASARKRALNMFQPWYQTRLREQPEKKTPSLKKLVANLLLDTRLKPGLGTPAVAGLRSAATFNAPYQLLYSFDEGEVEVDLKVRLNSAGDKVSLMGQVVGLEDSGCKVELVSTPENQTRPASLDETCTFTYPDLPRGAYILRISCRENQYEVNAISL